MTLQLQKQSSIKAPINVSFDKSQFDDLIMSKGYYVTKEISVKCPCRSKNNNNQLSSCMNCGGTGWAFINPTETRMVLQSMNISTEYKEWSEVNLGQVRLSCLGEEDITFMDRVTIKSNCDNRPVKANHAEVLHSRREDDKLFVFTSYSILSISYVLMFQSDTEKYLKLNEGEDFFFNKGSNIITFEDKFAKKDLSFSIRYSHLPQFHIIDINREVSGSFIKEGGVEKQIQLPVSAIGKRSHYILDAENIKSNRILDNSFNKTC